MKNIVFRKSKGRKITYQLRQLLIKNEKLNDHSLHLYIRICSGKLKSLSDRFIEYAKD